MHKKQMLKLDILIDDCLDNFKDAEYTGICLKYPWNENGDLENVIYADDWAEIASIILAEGIASIVRGRFLSDKDKRDMKK
jgi:5'(3')-deoxyribonucleotidase